MEDFLSLGFILLGFTFLFTPLSNILFTKKKLFIKYNRDNALEPIRGSIESAGYDLFSCENGKIQPHSKKIIDIGISLVIPYGYYGRIAPRSGLTLKHSINVGAGVIDSDYRGNISVILFNHSDEVFNYNEGDKIAQLIIEKIGYFEIKELAVLDNFESERGIGGFGSTGYSNKNIINYYNNGIEEENNREEEFSEQENSNEENSAEELTEEESAAEENTAEENTSEESTTEEKTTEENTTEEKNKEQTEDTKKESSDEESKEFVKVE